MNETAKKICCAAVALTLMVSAFSACGKQEGEGEPITRGSEGIAAPQTQTTSAPATKAETTTAAPTTAATTRKQPANSPKPPKNPPKIPQGSFDGTDLTASLINALGFNYDSNENVFYTELDSWQRSGNYIGHYDALAKFGNMRYKTMKLDFNAPDNSGQKLNWRLQFWKGQYGPFGGAEIGVYTQVPGTTDELYYCADDDHLLHMTYTMYLTPEDYYASRSFFTRGWQKHWWLTGFKAEPMQVNPSDMVMQARIRLYNADMADGMEQGLQAAGFQEGDAVRYMDTYKRVGYDFFILWKNVGDLNYRQS